MTQSPQEGLVSRYLNRRLSRPLAALLARTPLTPNHVSFVSFVIALVSLSLFFAGYNIWAGIVAQLSSVFDGADGDLARIKDMASPFGGFFDAVLDRYADVAILAGFTYWALEFEARVADSLVLALGLLAIAGSLMISYSRARAEATLGGRFPGLAGSLASRDARLFVVMLGAIAGQGVATLLVIATATNFVVVWRLAVARRGMD